MSKFAIIVHIDNLDDAFDIYDRIIMKTCKSRADATLTSRHGNEVKILDNSNLQTGVGHAGAISENRTIQ